MKASQPSQHVVLVVDDSPDTLSMLNDCLEKADMTTLVALEGPQAILIAQSMHPDIILLDAVMPGMNGFEVCRELKSINSVRSIPVIFMTGLSDTQHIVEGFEAGGVDYLTKPIRTNELLARMKAHLTNAKVTQSAQSALDVAGHFIFAVNHRGQFLWSTPQVDQLLSQSRHQQTWASQELPELLNDWFSHNPLTNMSLTVQAPEKDLRLTLIRQNSEDNEYLLRVEDASNPNDLLMLKQHFKTTPRESEVLLWIARGKTNREIGQILGTSPRTINKHLEQIFKKLNVENRTTAAAKALQTLNAT